MGKSQGSQFRLKFSVFQLPARAGGGFHSIQARTHAGLTQEQLAERMHTTQAVIARLESGRVKPSTRNLERLAEATGIAAADFVRAVAGELRYDGRNATARR
jgi:transcriptional regulator with XRE-family HTH domain